MSAEPIRVLCVDDHAILAEGLKARLADVADIEFCGWLDSTETLIAEARELRPHIVLLDIEMPGPDPFDALEQLQRELPNIRTIMFSAYVRDRYIDEAVSRGAWGYLSKSDSPDEVIKAIRRAEKGEFVFSPQVEARFRSGGGGKRAESGSKLQRLTPREIQILRLIGKGLSRGEIAAELHRSPKTIDNHRAAIMEKLDIHDTVELARYAIREGLVEA